MYVCIFYLKYLFFVSFFFFDLKGLEQTKKVEFIFSVLLVPIDHFQKHHQ
jgi:hypothetical protein